MMKDRRQWPRLPLKLNVEFLAQQDRHEASGTGITKDVSAGGLYFMTRDWERLKLGQDLSLRVGGFSTYDSGPLFRSLRGKVSIVRLDVPEASSSPHAEAGVAAQFYQPPRFDSYGFSQ